ncbi:hypothetical protein predicted by Glimmer/Critica [Lactiplantibacillus plantarum]|nr:hypothetical protein predicted by Glimmer/Critica [Lactiplantibacillus plantarum]
MLVHIYNVYCDDGDRRTVAVARAVSKYTELVAHWFEML